MGINYYIVAIISGKNNTKYLHTICHIGKGSRLNINELLRFFCNFLPENRELMKWMHQIFLTIGRSQMTLDEATVFKLRLCEIYDFYIGYSENFHCKDEYGKIMSFREVLSCMSTKYQDIILSPIDEGADGYIINELHVATDSFVKYPD